MTTAINTADFATAIDNTPSMVVADEWSAPILMAAAMTQGPFTVSYDGVCGEDSRGVCQEVDWLNILDGEGNDLGTLGYDADQETLELANFLNATYGHPLIDGDDI